MSDNLSPVASVNFNLSWILCLKYSRHFTTLCVSPNQREEFPISNRLLNKCKYNIWLENINGVRYQCQWIYFHCSSKDFSRSWYAVCRGAKFIARSFWKLQRLTVNDGNVDKWELSRVVGMGPWKRCWGELRMRQMLTGGTKANIGC